MATDGAHFGVSAERALKMILGGEPSPGPEEMESVGAMRERLLALDTNVEPQSYNEAADLAAALVLRWLLEDPARAQGPVENEYDWTGTSPKVIAVGWYDRMKADGLHLPEGLSGFQWGWASNAARRCVELAPAPNPALLEVRPE